MSTPTKTAIPSAPLSGAGSATASGLVPYRLTVRQFEKMNDAGVFRDEDHVELLGGLLVDKMVKQDPHNFTIDMLGDAKDRGTKWRKYAACGISVYWIVNLPLRQLEVYSGPAGRGKSAGYRDCKIYGPDDEVPLVLDGRELRRIKVSEVLA